MSPARRPKVSNAKAAKAGKGGGPRPKAARAAARSAASPKPAGRGRSSSASTRGRGAAGRSAAPAGASRGTPGAAARTDRTDARDHATARSGPTRGGRADRGLGGDQVEGRQAVRELLLAGRRKVIEVWVASDQDEAVVLDDIAELALSLGVPVRDVSRQKLRGRARTESPQGVLALAKALPEADLDDLLEPRSAGRGQPTVDPFLLLVDGVTDPGNLGALLRSAEGAGVTGVVLPKHRAVHITPTVSKSAAGAIEYLPMAIVGGLPAAMTTLHEAGFTIVGLDAGGTDVLYDIALDLGHGPVALVLGSEGKGLSRLVRQRCDVLASIPLGGRLASLNVAAAGALACFEVTRRRYLGRAQ